MAGKIALIGSAPSSATLAPYGDSTWEKWGCSPALVPQAKGPFDAWFELHPIRPEYQFSPAYMKFMSETKMLWLAQPDEQLPNGLKFPKEVADEFCHIGRTSTVGWMLMLAIHAKPDEIGIWGVDMSHITEWGEQRLGCQYLIWEARKRGIKVTLPQESDLDIQPFEYGFAFFSPVFRKLQVREKELTDRLAQKASMIEAEKTQHVYLSGARENLQYIIKTYPYDQGLSAPMPQDGEI